MTKILFAADLHGNRYAYENLFKIANSRNIETIVLGGDLTPKTPILHFLNNIAIPLHPSLFCPDKNGVTYQEALKQIREISERNTKKTIEHFTKLGGWLHYTGVQTTWDELINEQSIIDKIYQYIKGSLDVKYGPASRSDNPLKLTEKEKKYLISSIIPLIEKICPKEKKEKLVESLKYAILTKEERGFAIKNLESILGNIKKEKNCEYISKILKEIIYTSIEKITNARENLIKNGEFIASYLNKENKIARHYKAAGNLDRSKKEQSRFLKYYLSRTIKEHKKNNPNLRTYIILGNDDMEETEKDIITMEKKGLICYINQKILPISEDLFITGYPFVKNSEGKFYGAWEKFEKEIGEDLENLALHSDPKRTIYVTHSPPNGGKLDIAYNGEHIGSTAIKAFITKHQPFLVLSGHVHESFRKSGTIMEKIGNTFCYNPGGEHDKDKLCAVIIDTNNLQNNERIYEVVQKCLN